MIHISIEGMDGVGKSTLCKKLADKLGYKFVEKPLHYLYSNEDDISMYQEMAKKVNANPDRTFTSWYYALNNIYLYTLFKDQNIVTDRHIVSNYCWSGTDDNMDVYDLLLSKIGKPTLTVILYAKPQAILKRLIGRNPNDSDLYKVTISEEKYEKMIYFCEIKKLPYIVIDSSELESDEVVDIILERIGDVQNG